LEPSERLAQRLSRAQERFSARVSESAKPNGAPLAFDPLAFWNYSVDLAQRSILFWDTLRERGNNFIAHERAGKPPLLHFEHETVMDGRKFARPVNYALLRMKPFTDSGKRPYIIIDPRAGHGPGIGAFKDDSQAAPVPHVRPPRAV